MTVADRDDLPLAVLRIDPDSEVIDGFDDMMVRFSPNLCGHFSCQDTFEPPERKLSAKRIEPNVKVS